ncbi:hypothetical protein ACMXYV_17680 [Neptuniibacter sp. SY11_33]|uniref:hypothetical protein n=1 Tax=Neptuniibacter sp. SY11_33 TaxID=3398215 RepID=UPI0039F49B77
MVKKIIWGILLLLVAGTFLAWLTQDKWLPGWNQELADQNNEFQQRGLELGQKSDQQTCLEEALSSFNQCSGFSCTIKHGKFLKACLNNASPSENFCKDVPEFREERTEDDKSWARHACWSRDVRGEGCRLLMRQQQLFCSEK